MNPIVEFWNRLSGAARAGLGIGLLAIIMLVGGLAWWTLRADYQVLFADLTPADAAAMTADLDKAKTPYRLSGEGRTILVPADLVYRTRLKLMSKDVPLHGAIGFEVFNNADFGMTDFVQKVNYQRAIQGELQRTIGAMDDVQAVRVHLALPEQGLFRKAAHRGKASVTLTLKPGHALAGEQVAGIQRLVAASVPDLAIGDVTVLDQHGVALTRVGGEGTEEGMASLDMKRGSEDYLLKKVNRVLEQTFGPGEAVASIDLSLNLDQSKVTTEEVLPGRATGAAGVAVRERRVVNEAPPRTEVAQTTGGSSTTESDYQVGRRVEQLAVASGTVRRMTVAVLVKQNLNEDQLGKLKEVVGLAVGLNQERGDALVVYSMNQFGALPGMLPVPTAADANVDAVPGAAAPGTARTVPPVAPTTASRALWLLGALLAGACAALGIVLAGRRRAVQPARLDDAARARLVLEIREWIDTPEKRQTVGMP